MAAVGEPANLAHPEVVGQAATALSQLHCDRFATAQSDAMGAKLFHSPIVLWKLVIGEKGDSLLPQMRKQLRTVAFSIDDHREPVGARIVGQPLLQLRAFGYGGLQPRNHILLERRDASGDDFLIAIEKRLTVNRIEPVIGRRSQAEPLACDIVAW